MTKEKIKEAYKIAKKYAKTTEEAVQVGIQMAINGEVVITNNNIKIIDWYVQVYQKLHFSSMLVWRTM